MRRVLMLLLLGALPLCASVPLPTAPTRYVTDAANVIPEDRENALNEKLAQFERDTTNQVIVYVDRRVPAGTTLEEMGAEAIRTWAVGQAKKDNGAILFLFIDDRKSRIEVGYGLEGVLTDARSKWILVGMRDALRAGDYATAVEAGANGILETIKPPAAPPPRRVGGRHIARPSTTNDLPALLVGCAVIFFFLAVAGLVIYALLKIDWKSGGRTINPSPINPSPSVWPTTPPTDFSSSSSFPSSSSDSSSFSPPSSDFSGGGGSGGGGGSSDSW